MSAEIILRQWREDPVKFVWDHFKVAPDLWQLDVLRAFPSMDADKLRISMQACAGPGKSAVLAWLAWNFMVCYSYPGHHPKGAAISITEQNLKDNLWAELAKWRSKSAYLMEKFEWTQKRIFAKDHPETWFMSARSFSKTSDTEEQGRTLSGLHSEYVLYIIDESGDIPPAVLRSAEQGLSSCVWGKIIQAGNPTSIDGMLYAAATLLRHQWFVVRITGDPEDPKRSPRINIEWAREQIKQWGRDNPWVMSFILGQFPPGGINTLFPLDLVEAAMSRHLSEDKYSFSERRLGCDVARYGDDRSVIFPRQGLAAFKPVEMRGHSTDQIAGRLIKAKMKWDSDTEFIDGTGGFGAGVVDNMRLARYTPYEINSSSKAIDPKFANKRAEMYFEALEWLKRGGALPRNSQMLKELTVMTYTADKGRLILEPKELFKKRLGFSPDIADAWALTFALPDMPRQIRLPGGYVVGGGQAMDADLDYNPYDSRRLM